MLRSQIVGGETVVKEPLRVPMNMKTRRIGAGRIDVVVFVCLEEEGESRLTAAGILVHFYVGIRRWGNYLQIKEIIANAGIFAQY